MDFFYAYFSHPISGWLNCTYITYMACIAISVYAVDTAHMQMSNITRRKANILSRARSQCDLYLCYVGGDGFAYNDRPVSRHLSFPPTRTVYGPIERRHEALPHPLRVHILMHGV